MQPENNSRLVWVDIAKALGILLVVVGHVEHIVPRDGDSAWIRLSRAIYLFHMPLFFMLAGLTHRPQAPAEAVTSKWRALIWPYFFWLLLIGLWFAAKNGFESGSLAWLLRGTLLGGRYLSGDFAVFWFLPVLFAVIVIHDWLFARQDGRRLILALALFGLISGPAVMQWTRGVPVPWLANLVPMAFFFFTAGAMLRPVLHRRKWLAATALFVVGLSGLAALFGVKLSLAMKFANFGPVLLGSALAVALSVLLMLLAMALSQSRLAQGGLVWIGRRTVPLMFLHMPVLLLLAEQGIPPLPVILLATVLSLPGVYLMDKARALISPPPGRPGQTSSPGGANLRIGMQADCRKASQGRMTADRLQRRCQAEANTAKACPSWMHPARLTGSGRRASSRCFSSPLPVLPPQPARLRRWPSERMVAGWRQILRQRLSEARSDLPAGFTQNRPFPRRVARNCICVTISIVFICRMAFWLPDHPDI
ncbi:acyltransferase family protein [Pseudogemmobacter bohemicus]|uniref:acyltransferase family protein n=1 Tax=Pseudogemmobacter bohemicus TaxID=2250708 RepID=UPI000DD4E751|nr:acyltransferase family protein [Pseudogemmobacter bohemicus]